MKQKKSLTATLREVEMENDILRRGSDAAVRMTEKAIDERNTLRNAMVEIRKMTARRFTSMEDVGNFAYETLSKLGDDWLDGLASVEGGVKS